MLVVDKCLSKKYNTISAVVCIHDSHDTFIWSKDVSFFFINSIFIRYFKLGILRWEF